MKRKEAIKKLRQGNVQIFNDKGNDKEFIKLFFEAFPDSEHKNDKVVLSGYNYGLIDFSSYKFNFVKEKTLLKKGIKIIKLSSITKPKTKNKLKQLEKGYSELCKDVAELKSLVSVPAEVKFEPDFENVKAEEKTVLEVGKWYYVDNVSKYLLLFSGKDISFGFMDGKYGDWMFSEDSNQKYAILATPQEVEQALIAEAKKRGYKKGVDCLFGLVKQQRTLTSSIFRYKPNYNALLLGNDGIFQGGIWAEIIKETPIKEDEIDWSKPQLFIGIKSDALIMSTGNHTAITFEGYIVKESSSKKNELVKNELWDSHGKEYFKPFKGTLTINKE